MTRRVVHSESASTQGPGAVTCRGSPLPRGRRSATLHRVSKARANGPRTSTGPRSGPADGTFRAVHAALVVVLLLAVAAVLLPGRRIREDPGDVLRALRAARGPGLPAADRVGATSQTAPARYGKDTLAD